MITDIFGSILFYFYNWFDTFLKQVGRDMPHLSSKGPIVYSKAVIKSICIVVIKYGIMINSLTTKVNTDCITIQFYIIENLFFHFLTKILGKKQKENKILTDKT